MSIIKDAAQALMKKAVELAPDSLIPGGRPDPLIRHKHGLIGQPISRIDGPLKVKGAARFAAEFELDGMVYAALAYSTVARGRIQRLDTREAEAAPGVVLVMTHLNAPKMNPPPAFGTAPKAAGGDTLPVMQDDTIHWNGEPIAVVLAETQEQADYAKSLIRATYAVEPSVTSFEAAKAKGAKTASFQGEKQKLAVGDAEAALAAAPYRVDAIYRTPRHTHNAIEPHAATLAWHGDELVVHDATQAVAHTAWTLAQVFGVAEGQVHVTSPYVGGGFGSKTLWGHHILAAAAARLAGRPVRVALSREGVYRIVGGRTLTEQRVAIGAAEDGGFEAIIHTGTVLMTDHNAMPEPFIVGTRSGYASKTFSLDVEAATADMVANTFMRAPGEAVGTFALECAIDELAVELGMDPIALRERNEPRKDPTTGLPFSSRHIMEAYHNRRPAFRLGAEERHAWRPAGRRVAGGDGLRHGDLPLLPHARRRGPHHHQSGRSSERRHRGARNGHGYGDGSDPGGGGPAGPALRPCQLRLWRLFVARLGAGRGLAADGVDRHVGDHRPPRPGDRAAQAGGQRLAAGGA